MKEIKFNPLRILKKSGKIAVASYSQWRKIKVSDYEKFTLIINDEYKKFPRNERVYNHKGEELFWRNYNPNEIQLLNGVYQVLPNMWKTDYMYSAKGLDCDGVPIFSHGTVNEIIKDHTRDITEYELLTVGIVQDWFGWFLFQLENVEL